MFGQVRIKSTFILALTGIALLTSGCSEESTETQEANPPACQPSESTANYVATLVSNWTSTNHPTDFPSDGSFTEFLGVTHDSTTTLFTAGWVATTGFEEYVETGTTTTFATELAALVSNGSAGVVVTGDSGTAAGGSSTITFTASTDYPYLSVVARISPSPDWFVGVSKQLLCENNQWLTDVAVTLQPWDAATDSGLTYSAADADVSPSGAMSEITTSPFESGGSVANMGTITFVKQ